MPTDSWREALPLLTGTVVQLREISFLDAPGLFALISEDPQVEQYISPPPPSVHAFQAFIAWAQRERAAGRSVCYAVVPKPLAFAVGLFQVRALDPDFFIAEWGFALGSSFWSTGVFEDAATLVADFTFRTLGAQRLEGRAVTANGRGNGALHKIGARGEAVLRRALERDGIHHEQFLWTLIAQEWQAQDSRARARFSAATTRRQIHDAIAQVERELAKSAPAPVPGQNELHPFFITGRSRCSPQTPQTPPRRDEPKVDQHQD
jgi:RimJ/RimL family protein N-acetyltransferase